MSSIEELKVIRLFRALNTMIQLCHDRGYTVRHPTAIAEAIHDSAIYDPVEGLDYDWFLQRFVITPERVTALSSATVSSAAAAPPGQIVNGSPHHRDEEAAGDDELDEIDASLLERAAKGQWIPMRNAMRLTCSIGPTHPLYPTTTSSPATSAAAAPAVAALPKNALMVFFSGAPALTIKEVQSFREKALRKKSLAMIIVANKVAGAIRRDVQELSGRMDEATGAELLPIQVFEEEALAFNVAHHETVPHHAALSEAEAIQFLEDRHLNISQLPRMLESDPMVQYLGLQRGSIVHITRESKESGAYSMYRQVM